MGALPTPPPTDADAKDPSVVDDERSAAKRAPERQVHATERLAAMATLTQGIAHEINTPLAIALLGIDDALDRVDRGDLEPSALRESLGSAREAMNRMVGIVQSMKLLGRLDTTEREQVDVKAMLEESLTLATTEIRYRARVVSELEEVGTIEGNGAQVSHVFLSLLMDVAHALPEEHSEANEIRVSMRRNGRVIEIEIADNALEDPNAVARQGTFDRFFTSGDAGHVGIGVSVARDILAALGGAIHVESKSGSSPRFRITLPACAEQLPLPAAETSPASETTVRTSSHRDLARRARVLVVDDEPLIGRSLQRHLLPRYDVDTVRRGREAIERILGKRYDAILCDLMMPEVSGADVFEEVTRARPELASRFIFMTGGAFTPRGREFLASVAAPVLAKPFELALLDEAVRRTARAAPSGDVSEAPPISRRHPGARE